MHGDDEDEERRRQAKERAGWSLLDRLHGAPPCVTDSGFIDQRSKRRTGRVVGIGLRVHPRVKALFDLIVERDRPPSLAVLFEEMLEAYCKVHGAVDTTRLPSDAELVQRYEQGQDKKYAE